MAMEFCSMARLMVLAQLVGACTLYGSSDDAKSAPDTPPTPPPAIPPPASGGGPLGFAPSNLDPAKLDFTGLTDDIEVTDECDIDSDGQSLCTAKETQFKMTSVDQPGGGRISIFLVKSIRIEQTANVLVRGPFAVAIVAKESIDIVGSMVAHAGNGGGFNGSTSRIGRGPGGGSEASGGSFCGVGGHGDSGVPGAAYGTDTMVPLIGGSAGGPAGAGGGGAGGGALELVAGKTVNVTGFVSMPGGAGEINSGGAGSGGAILIESPTVTISGTLAANGGGGGVGNGTGSEGLPNASPAPGDPNGAGNGSAGTSLDGAAGTKGGGGAGRIRIRGNASITGTVSPAKGTKCVTFGAI
jgi:hypothetical protein